MGANEKHDAAFHGRMGLDAELAAENAAKPSAVRATPEPEAPKAAPMSPVGKWSVGIVALAIVAPFVAILWAWAADVVRSFG